MEVQRDLSVVIYKDDSFKSFQQCWLNIIEQGRANIVDGDRTQTFILCPTGPLP